MKMNTGAFGMDFSAAGTNRFVFAVDGEQTLANFTINVNGSATVESLYRGNFAASVQNALRTGGDNIADMMSEH